MRSYTIIDHTADFGIQVFGNTCEELYAHAGTALFDLLVKKKNKTVCKEIPISVSGMDWPDLMVNWLRELLNLWTDQKYILLSVTLSALDEFAFTASLKLALFDPKCDEISHDIKAVTYHQIDAKPVSGRWEAKIIFDV